MKLLSTLLLGIILNLSGSEKTKKHNENQNNNEKIGNYLICPITNEKFVITQNTPKITYNDKEYYFCCSHCIENFKQNPKKYENETDLKIGNKMICPVMKTEFIPNSKSPKVQYKNKIYYFCCEECLIEFNKNPEKFVSKNIKKCNKKCKCKNKVNNKHTKCSYHSI
ncbi:MAG: YHS domain-containing protein [Elusimicrobiales bacterium]|nr:YHS domain-containing protein [Elusimicrobiales bacterium]